MKWYYSGVSQVANDGSEIVIEGSLILLFVIMILTFFIDFCRDRVFSFSDAGR
jgi:hypothetical protein